MLSTTIHYVNGKPVSVNSEGASTITGIPDKATLNAFSVSDMQILLSEVVNENLDARQVKNLKVRFKRRFLLPYHGHYYLGYLAKKQKKQSQIAYCNDFSIQTMKNLLCKLVPSDGAQSISGLTNENWLTESDDKHIRATFIERFSHLAREDLDKLRVNMDYVPEGMIMVGRLSTSVKESLCDYLEAFPTETMKYLLCKLVPSDGAQSISGLTNENWLTESDDKHIRATFIERFSHLPREDLDKLRVNMDYVPEGMITINDLSTSVQESLSRQLDVITSLSRQLDVMTSQIKAGKGRAALSTLTLIKVSPRKKAITRSKATKAITRSKHTTRSNARERPNTRSINR
jgi:transcriptional regulator CtsR